MTPLLMTPLLMTPLLNAELLPTAVLAPWLLWPLAATNTPTGWADMVDGFRTASFSSRLKIPIIYGLDVVHGVGPVKGSS